jgi:hypothetical protein
VHNCFTSRVQQKTLSKDIPRRRFIVSTSVLESRLLFANGFIVFKNFSTDRTLGLTLCELCCKNVYDSESKKKSQLMATAEKFSSYRIIASFSRFFTLNSD